MEEDKNNIEAKIEETCQKLKEITLKKMNKTLEDSIDSISIDSLYKMTDIIKDYAEIDYKKKLKEEDNMRYNNYGEYSGDNYGRRGVPGTGRGRYRAYRGEDALDEMKYYYGNYMDSQNYGAKEDSSDRMVESFKKFVFSTADELEPQDKMKFKRAMQEVMQDLN